jgi:transposase
VRFLDSGTWPLDSNPVENAIRPYVVGRRSGLFADTVGGAKASANLYSLIETAKITTSSPTAASLCAQEAAAGPEGGR